MKQIKTTPKDDFKELNDEINALCLYLRSLLNEIKQVKIEIENTNPENKSRIRVKYIFLVRFNRMPSKRRLTCRNWNSNGLQNEFLELQTINARIKPDILFITETKTAHNKRPEIKIYNLHSI